MLSFKLIKTLKLATTKRQFSLTKMAKSRYEYVKTFENDDKILQNCWIVVRVDGKGFHKFSKCHDFDKPNDKNGLNLMNNAAVAVMQEFRDISIAYGQSDEYSFVFHKSSEVFNRRSSKILSYVNSLFTSAYVFNWSHWFPNKTLQYPPCFDARIVLYPSDQNLKDYLSWRQADVHINNLYNTTFWNLVLKDGLSNTEAETTLRGTFSADKNEILFARFGINYNKEPGMFRKGTTLFRKQVKLDGGKDRVLIVPFHDDIIGERFWKNHADILEKKKSTSFEFTKNNNELYELPEIVTRQLEKLAIN